MAYTRTLWHPASNSWVKFQTANAAGVPHATPVPYQLDPTTGNWNQSNDPTLVFNAVHQEVECWDESLTDGAMAPVVIGGRVQYRWNHPVAGQLTQRTMPGNAALGGVGVATEDRTLNLANGAAPAAVTAAGPAVNVDDWNRAAAVAHTRGPVPPAAPRLVGVFLQTASPLVAENVNNGRWIRLNLSADGQNLFREVFNPATSQWNPAAQVVGDFQIRVLDSLLGNAPGTMLDVKWDAAAHRLQRSYNHPIGGALTHEDYSHFAPSAAVANPAVIAALALAPGVVVALPALAAPAALTALQLFDQSLVLNANNIVELARIGTATINQHPHVIAALRNPANQVVLPALQPNDARIDALNDALNQVSYTTRARDLHVALQNIGVPVRQLPAVATAIYTASLGINKFHELSAASNPVMQAMLAHHEAVIKPALGGLAPGPNPADPALAVNSVNERFKNIKSALTEAYSFPVPPPGVIAGAAAVQAAADAAAKLTRGLTYIGVPMPPPAALGAGVAHQDFRQGDAAHYALIYNAIASRAQIREAMDLAAGNPPNTTPVAAANLQHAKNRVSDLEINGPDPIIKHFAKERSNEVANAFAALPRAADITTHLRALVAPDLNERPGVVSAGRTPAALQRLGLTAPGDAATEGAFATIYNSRSSRQEIELAIRNYPRHFGIDPADITTDATALFAENQFMRIETLMRRGAPDGMPELAQQLFDGPAQAPVVRAFRRHLLSLDTADAVDTFYRNLLNPNNSLADTAGFLQARVFTPVRNQIVNTISNTVTTEEERRDVIRRVITNPLIARKLIERGANLGGRNNITTVKAVCDRELNTWLRENHGTPGLNLENEVNTKLANIFRHPDIGHIRGARPAAGIPLNRAVDDLMAVPPARVNATVAEVQEAQTRINRLYRDFSQNPYMAIFADLNAVGGHNNIAPDPNVNPTTDHINTHTARTLIPLRNLIMRNPLINPEPGRNGYALAMASIRAGDYFSEPNPAAGRDRLVALLRAVTPEPPAPGSLPAGQEEQIIPLEKFEDIRQDWLPAQYRDPATLYTKTLELRDSGRGQTARQDSFIDVFTTLAINARSGDAAAIASLEKDKPKIDEYLTLVTERKKVLEKHQGEVHSLYLSLREYIAPPHLAPPRVNDRILTFFLTDVHNLTGDRLKAALKGLKGLLRNSNNVDDILIVVDDLQQNIDEHTALITKLTALSTTVTNTLTDVNADKAAHGGQLSKVMVNPLAEETVVNLGAVNVPAVAPVGGVGGAAAYAHEAFDFSAAGNTLGALIRQIEGPARAADPTLGDTRLLHAAAAGGPVGLAAAGAVPTSTINRIQPGETRGSLLTLEAGRSALIVEKRSLAPANEPTKHSVQIYAFDAKPDAAHPLAVKLRHKDLLKDFLRKKNLLGGHEAAIDSTNIPETLSPTIIRSLLTDLGIRIPGVKWGMGWDQNSIFDYIKTKTTESHDFEIEDPRTGKLRYIHTTLPSEEYDPYCKALIEKAKRIFGDQPLVLTPELCADQNAHLAILLYAKHHKINVIDNVTKFKGPTLDQQIAYDRRAAMHTHGIAIHGTYTQKHEQQLNTRIKNAGLDPATKANVDPHRLQSDASKALKDATEAVKPVVHKHRR